MAQTPAPTTEPQANLQEGSSVQESAASAEITWYQEQLASYQQALYEWQLWGEQQAAEIEQLKQQIEQQAGQVEQLRQQGMQDQVTMKQLEVQEKQLEGLQQLTETAKKLHRPEGYVFNPNQNASTQEGNQLMQQEPRAKLW